MRKHLILAEGEPAKLLTSLVSVAIQAAAAGEGKLPTFTMHAYGGGTMNVGWMDPVVVDLAGVTLAAEKLPILRSHDMECIVGHTSAVRISATGIDVEGVISGGGEDAAEVVAAAKNGFPWQASIGADPMRIEFLEAGAVATVNGKQITGPARIVRACRLYEVSFVPIGADTSTSASVAAQKTKENAMTFEQWLKAKGFDKATLTAAQLTLLEAEFKANASDERITALKAAFAPPAPATPPAPVTPPAAPAVTTPADPTESIRAEYARIAKIETICGDKHGDIKAKAIAEKWTVTDTELAVLRAARPQAPAAFIPSSGNGSPRVLEAALCLSQPQLANNEKALLASYGEQTLNEADRFRRLGLRRTIEMLAAHRGVSLPMDVNGDWLRAAFSMADLSGILGNVANKALASAFMAIRQVAPRISKPVSHTNFHAHTVYSMALSGDMEEVGKTGELASLKFGEESWTRQLKTRGAKLTVTRQDIINDTLGAFVDNAVRLSRKAVVAREKATFKLINATGAGASFFTAARGNYFEGAGTALSISALTSAVQKFRDQTGPDNDPVMIEPKILLLPTALEETGKALMDRAAQMIAVALGSTSSKSKEPNANVWAGSFAVEVSEWLSKTIDGTAGSSTAFYLLADPMDVAAVELAYLNGQQQPTIEYFGMDQDVDVLGVSWRIYWDFAAALAEYRAGVKSKGAA